MDSKQFSSLFTKLIGQNKTGVSVNFDKVDKFFRLTERMLTENEKYNLTAITDPPRMIVLHYLDSLTLSPYLKKGAKVADIGTGAGFPALPLAICREDLDVWAFDATEKRVRYVEETARMLSLSNLTAQTLRAEAGAKDAALRERFDAVTARGVAQLRVLCEYCLPYVKVGGRFLAMKGQSAQGEVSEAKRAIAMLGGRFVEIVPTPLVDEKGEKVEHNLVIIEKIAKTNAQYPRENNKILKKPL